MPQKEHLSQSTEASENPKRRMLQGRYQYRVPPTALSGFFSKKIT